MFARRVSLALLLALTSLPACAGETAYFRFNRGSSPDGKGSPGEAGISAEAGHLVLRQGRQVSTVPAVPAGGTPPYAWDVHAGTLPSGLRLGTDGVLSGAAAALGTASGIVLSLTDSEGRNGFTNPFSIGVVGLPSLAYPSVRVRAGRSFALPPQVRNLVGTPAYLLTAGSLPPGLSIDAGGAIRGVMATPGTSGPLAVTLTDADGEPATSPAFSIEAQSLAPSLSGQDLDLRVGQDFVHSLVAEGFSSAPRYDLVSGALPEGVVLDRDNGTLSGAPLAAGSFAGIVVTATAADGSLASTEPFALHVGAAEVTNPGALRASLNRRFEKRIEARNLPQGVVWQSMGAAMPPGMGLTSDGWIQGVPTALGTWAGIEAVTSDGARAYATGAFSIEVTADALQVGMPDIVARRGSTVRRTPRLEPPTPGTSYTLNGLLPTGLAFDAATGAVAGIPTVAGSVSGLRLGASGGGLSGTSPAFSVTVVPDLEAQAGALSGMVGRTFEGGVAADGAIGAVSWRLVSGSLPPGLAFDADGRIRGTPTAAGTTLGLVARATDAADGSSADTPPFSVTIAQSDRMLVSAPSGLFGTRVGRPFALPAPLVQNAVGKTSFQVSGALPQGLAVDPDTGVISSRSAPVPAVGSGEPLGIVVTDQRPSTATSPGFAIRLVGALAVEGGGSVATRVGTVVNREVAARNLIGSPRFELVPPEAGGSLPEGLYLGSSSGRIFGRPTRPGRLGGARLRLVDAADGEAVTSEPFDLVVEPGLVLDGPAALKARVGVPFDSGAAFSVREAPGSLEWTLRGTLPDGLSHDPATGRISGTPRERRTVSGLSFAATQPSTGLSGEGRPFSLEVEGAMEVVLQPNQGVRINEPASISPGTRDAVGAVAWSIVRGSPPIGMGFDAGTGRIYGTPTVIGTYGPLVLRARDEIGQVAVSGEVTITVGSQLRLATSPTVFRRRIGSPFAPFNPFRVTGATGAWKVTWSGLPAGVMGAEDGTLSGRFESPNAFYQSYVATVTDSTGAKLTQGITFEGWWDRPYLTGMEYPSSRSRRSVSQAAVGKPVIFSARNPNFPYYEGIVPDYLRHFEPAPGVVLPDWATLNRRTGDLYGTPPAAGEYAFGVVLVDDTDGARSDPHEYVIQAKEAPTPAVGTTIKRRLGTSVTEPLLEKAYPGVKISNRYGRCRSNLADRYPGGKLHLDAFNCDVRLISYDNVTVGTWDGLWLEVVDDAGITRRVEFTLQVVPALTIASPGFSCTRGDPMAIKAPGVGGVIGNATFMTKAGSHNPDGPDQGFAFDAATGVLSGKPVAVGTRYAYTIGVRDDWDGAEAWSSGFNVELRVPLSIRYPGPVRKKTGDEETYLYAYDDGLPYGERRRFSLVSPPESLPPGIRFQVTGDDGFFVGRYEKGGTFDVVARVEAQCPDGLTADNAVRFEIAPRLWVRSMPDMTMVEGVPFRSEPPVFENAAAAVAWELRCCDALPKGVVVEKGTGRIVGTPALGTARSYTVGIYGNDGRSWGEAGPIRITVRPAPGLNYPGKTQGRAGMPMTVAAAPVAAVGPLSFALTPGVGIPSGAGLTLDPATGTLAGVPDRSVVASGLSVVMTDAVGGRTTSNAFDIEVGPGIEATIAPELAATVGVPFSGRATALGTEGATSWAVSEGALPDGLSIDAASGEIKGTPVLAGRFGGVRLRVIDGGGAAGTTEPFAIAVADGEPPPPTLGIACAAAREGVAAPTPTGGAGVDACNLSLWLPDPANDMTYRQWRGSVRVTDTQGALGGTLGGDYASVKVVDVETGRSHEVGAGDFSGVFDGYVTGSGTFSRRFRAIARTTSGATRVSATFTLTGTYGKSEPPPSVPSWKWGEVVCRSACKPDGSCEGRQLQSCSGTGCPSDVRSCEVSVDEGRGSPYAVGSAAGTACVAPFGPPDERRCFVEEPAGKVRLEPYWTVRINGTEAVVYKHPEGFFSPIRPTAGLFAAHGVPYVEEPYTATMLQFGVSGGGSGAATLSQTVPALVVDRAGLKKVYDAANRYDPRDIVVNVDGPVIVVAAEDASPIAKAIDAMSPGTSAIRGAGPYSIWHCVGSLCTARLRPK